MALTPNYERVALNSASPVPRMSVSDRTHCSEEGLKGEGWDASVGFWPVDLSCDQDIKMRCQELGDSVGLPRYLAVSLW